MQSWSYALLRKINVLFYLIVMVQILLFDCNGSNPVRYASHPIYNLSKFETVKSLYECFTNNKIRWIDSVQAAKACEFVTNLTDIDDLINVYPEEFI